MSRVTINGRKLLAQRWHLRRAALSRTGLAQVATPDLITQDGDVLYLAHWMRESGLAHLLSVSGLHIAAEWTSNVLTKILQRPRIGAYLEQSTRYIAYDTPVTADEWLSEDGAAPSPADPAGGYRYYRDPEVLGSGLGLRYIGDMDRLFDSYAELVPIMADFFRDQFPKDPSDSDFVYRQAIRAKAFDAVRGVLPAASISNVGIYGTGQAYEALLLRMRAHPLPEVRRYASMMLEELRLVIPSFLKRVDREDRGVAWSAYLAERQARLDLGEARRGDAVADRGDAPAAPVPGAAHRLRAD